MENKVNYAVVGAFILVLVGAMIAAALWLASGGAFQKKYDLYLAVEDESVAGLSQNAPVKYNGVDVGKVKQIHLDTDNPQRVRLILAIERGTPVKDDTVAVLKTQGLTGIAYIELSGGAADAAALSVPPGESYPQIRTKPSLGARLEDVLTTVLAKLDNTTNNVNAMLNGENQAALKNTLADMASLASMLAKRKDTIDAAIVQAALTVENTASASARLEPMIGRISQSAAAIEKMGNEVALTSVHAGKMVDTVNRGVRRFSEETQPELEHLLGELTALSTALRRLSEQTERNPSGLIFGRRALPPGPGETTGTPRQP